MKLRNRAVRFLLRQKRHLRILALGLMVGLLYALVVSRLVPVFGSVLFVLAVLPISILALAGKNYGAVGGILLTLVNAGLAAQLLPDLFVAHPIVSSSIDLAAHLLIGISIGHVRDLQDRLRRTLRQKQAAIHRIRYLALHDSLTGLLNNRLLKGHLDLELKHAKREDHVLALLFLDLDDFKHVNDFLGHGEGDDILRWVGRAIQASVRDSDTVARVGGDEFVVVLPRIQSAQDASDIASRIGAKVGQTSSSVRITASVGIALFPANGQTVDELIRCATEAMTVAKENGKGSFRFWDRVQHETVLQRMAIGTALIGARSRDEFVVCYQPILNVYTGKILGAEALLRWKNPGLGQVSPDVFIPIAERTGVIRDIGLWVLERVLKDMVELERQGLSVDFIAINVSSMQLIDPSFSGKVLDMIQDAGIEPAKIELEITETGIALQGNAAELLMPLKQTGVRIALDDFGTGNSSLRYLSELPIDVLKIDGSFVRKVLADPKAAVITHTIVSLALLLRLNVVAECIETEEQRETMFVMGCDRLQGYLFSPAVPFDRFLGHLMEGSSLKEISLGNHR